MVTAEVFRQSLREQRAAVVGWSASWLALVGLYVASWPAVRHNGEKYDAILRDLPSAFRALLGSAAGQGGLSTPEGYLSTELLSITGPLLVVAMGVLHGTRALAGEEESGTLEILLAQPVRRERVLAEKLAAVVSGVVVVLLVAGVGLALLGRSVDLGLSLGQCLRAALLLALLGVEAAALGMCFAAMTGNVGRGRALAGAVALAAFLLHALGPLIPAMKGAAKLSPFGTVVSSDPFRHAPGVATLAAFVVPSVVFATVGLLVFRRRDLRFS